MVVKPTSDPTSNTKNLPLPLKDFNLLRQVFLLKKLGIILIPAPSVDSFSQSRQLPSA
jgi:hypothetical protein